jgi:hypothetical protein
VSTTGVPVVPSARARCEESKVDIVFVVAARPWLPIDVLIPERECNTIGRMFILSHEAILTSCCTVSSGSSTLLSGISVNATSDGG